MKKNHILVLTLAVAGLCANVVVAQEIAVNIDWKNFLARHDLLWERMPRQWYEGPFLGNGMMGTMIYKGKGNALRWDVGRSDVQDHRDASYGYNMFARPRLPIGHFTLEPVGKITAASMRLDLWNAEASGRLTTDKGNIKWRSIVHTDEMAIITEIETTEGEKQCKWKFHPAEAISPRHVYGLEHDQPFRVMKDYKPNPPPRMESAGQIKVCIQPLLVGGQTATAWCQLEHLHSRTLIVTVAHSWPEETAKDLALATVERLAHANPGDLIKSHRDWWHWYYPAAFISIPNTRLEGFYWIQMYKLACLTRADRSLIDNQGPWLQPTPWPGTWWDLNVQLDYWTFNQSNRLQLGESLGRTLKRNLENLIQNAPEQYRHDSAYIGISTDQSCAMSYDDMGKYLKSFHPTLGCLPWACHNLWLHYRYSMNDKELSEQVFPILRRSINLYLHLLQEGEDGRLHLPVTHSPEYGNAPDCNFDLALLRWGCETLINASERLRLNDPLLPRWKQVLQKLTPYPVDETGLMIGRGVPYARSHRHYSHLLAIYPLYLINWEQHQNRELIEKSLKHWHALRAHHRGYSFTGAASISAAMGKGDEALRYLGYFCDDWLKPNTMYVEAGPCMETPLSAATVLHDMLIQSWGDKIRVFPAVPQSWQDVVVHNLRAEGAFLVSAVRKAGKTQFVRIKSLAGEPCKVKTDLQAPLQIAGDKSVWLKSLGTDLVELGLQKDQEVVLYSGKSETPFVIGPLPPQKTGCNAFGLRKSPDQPN